MLTLFSLNGNWTHTIGGNAYMYDRNAAWMFEVREAKSFPEQSVEYCWVKGICGENAYPINISWAAPIQNQH